jgi:hypothetical protein
MVASREERLYRAAVPLGKVKWDKDGNLEVVDEKCAKGDELEVVRKMAKVAKDGLETYLAKDIVRRMRKGRAHEERLQLYVEIYHLFRHTLECLA